MIWSLCSICLQKHNIFLLPLPIFAVLERRPSARASSVLGWGVVTLFSLATVTVSGMPLPRVRGWDLCQLCANFVPIFFPLQMAAALKENDHLNHLDVTIIIPCKSLISSNETHCSSLSEQQTLVTCGLPMDSGSEVRFRGHPQILYVFKFHLCKSKFASSTSNCFKDVQIIFLPGHGFALRFPLRPSRVARCLPGGWPSPSVRPTSSPQFCSAFEAHP